MLKSKIIDNRGLIIFVKNPVLGKVKTRLAKTIGNEKALQVYKNLMAHTQQVAIDTETSRYLFYDTEIAHNDEWQQTHFIKGLQASGDLGDRIGAAFQTVFSKKEKVIIIGSDCPEISSDIIEEAFDKLDLADVVIGPTHDGGYYLIGMKAYHASLFEDIAWSTEQVLTQTKEKITQQGLLFTLLKQLSDLDYEEDLNKFPAFSA